jgi:hypothetical protein
MKNSNLTYKQANCFDLCLQQELIKKCNCFDVVLGFYYTFNVSVPACKNIYQIFCAYNLYLDFYSSNLQEKCLDCAEECETTMFDAIVSHLDYPTLKFSDTFLLKDPRIISRFPNATVTHNDLKEKIAFVNVYLGELSYNKIEQVKLVSGFDLLSSIGGTMGLFMGLSLLSFIEIVEFLLEILVIIVRRQRIENDQKSETN